MTFNSFYKKLNNRHFLSLAGNGSMAVLSIVTYAVLYRLLPEADMGNWIFFQFAFALLDALRTGFLQTAFIKFYSGATDQRKGDVAASTWYIAFIITGLLALPNIPVLFALHSISDSGLLLFLQWYGLTLLFTFPFNVTFWILQAESRFDRMLILRIINQGSFILFIAFLYFFYRLTIGTLVYFYLASALITSVVPFILGWSKIMFRDRTVACVKEIFHFGKYSVGTYLTSTIFKYSDAFIIKFMIGPSALAVYNLAVRLLEVIEIPMRSFLATAMPAMSTAFNRGQNDKVSHLMKKYTGTLTIVLVPIVLVMIIFADTIVLLIGGHKYVDTEAANVFRIFMGCALLFPIERFSGITLDIIHKPQLNFIKILLSLVINIATDFIAIKLYGNVYGVAIASVFTLSFGVAFGYFALNKYLPFNLLDVLKAGYSESKAMLAGLVRKRSVL